MTLDTQVAAEPLDLQAAADRLADRVLADADLARRLLAILEAGAFAQAAAAACDLPVEAVRALTGHGWSGLVRHDLPPVGWLPVEVASGPGYPTRWAFFGEERLTDSFYQMSADALNARPLNRALRLWTPLDVVRSAPPGPAPDGLIFHMSRCGSTLAAQMLAASPAHVVVSEAQPIDAVVMLTRDGADGGALLRAMVAVMARRRNPEEQRLFLKLDCWHSLALPLFRQAFPRTPWIFQYRDPVEVLVSQDRQAGVQMVPELVPAAFYGLEGADGVVDADYHARVLAKVCEGALAAFPEGGGQLVDYRQLPGAVFTKILPHFGVAPDPAERALMAAAAGQDAKATWAAFTPDSADKRAEASETIRTAAARHLDAIHARLEAVRLAT